MLSLIDKFELGIVCKDRKVINHRSALKVFLTPFMRIFGLQIGTNFDGKRLKEPRFMKCEAKTRLKFKYGAEKPYRIVKKRIWI